jgi:hypothetical protein
MGCGGHAFLRRGAAQAAYPARWRGAGSLVFVTLVIY